ncbi:hypothetical protein V5799_001059 [Amblyomma americanum]|uniref:PH domain-containing protein n=1 Tax=Amblyomma americanum TaxID=6943 RepID=A0AAQ4D197_AMBAM
MGVVQPWRVPLHGMRRDPPEPGLPSAHSNVRSKQRNTTTHKHYLGVLHEHYLGVLHEHYLGVLHEHYLGVLHEHYLGVLHEHYLGVLHEHYLGVLHEHYLGVLHEHYLGVLQYRLAQQLVRFRYAKCVASMIVQEQWVRAKYEREEFVHQDRQIYQEGQMEGWLNKQGKEDGRFHPRRFVLSNGVLEYYVKESHKEPKASIPVSEINAVFCPDKIGNKHGLQLSYVKDGSTRNIFVYSEDGKVTFPSPFP